MDSPLSKYDFGLWQGDPPSPFATNILLKQLADEKRRREEEEARRQLESKQPSFANVFGQGPEVLGSAIKNAYAPDRSEGEKANLDKLWNEQSAPWSDPNSYQKASQGILDITGGNVHHALDTAVGIATDQGSNGLVTHPGNEAGQAIWNTASNAISGRMLPQTGILNTVDSSSPFKDLAKGVQTMGEDIGGMAIDPNTYIPSRMIQGIQSGQMLRGAVEGLGKENKTPEEWGHLAPLLFGAAHFSREGLKPRVNEAKVTEGQVGQVGQEQMAGGFNFEESKKQSAESDLWDKVALEAENAKKGIVNPPPESTLLHQNTAGLSQLLKQGNRNKVAPLNAAGFTRDYDKAAFDDLYHHPLVKRKAEELISKYGDKNTTPELLNDGSYHNVIDIGKDRVLRVNSRPYTKGEKVLEYPKVEGVLQPIHTETIKDSSGNVIKQIDIMPKIDTKPRPTDAQLDELRNTLLRQGYSLPDPRGSNADNVTVINGKAVAIDAGAVAPLDTTKKYETLKDQQIPKGNAFAAARKEKYDAITDMQASLRRGGFDFDELGERNNKKSSLTIGGKKAEGFRTQEEVDNQARANQERTKQEPWFKERSEKGQQRALATIWDFRERIFKNEKDSEAFDIEGAEDFGEEPTQPVSKDWAMRSNDPSLRRSGFDFDEKPTSEEFIPRSVSQKRKLGLKEEPPMKAGDLFDPETGEVFGGEEGVNDKLGNTEPVPTKPGTYSLVRGGDKGRTPRSSKGIYSEGTHYTTDYKSAEEFSKTTDKYGFPDVEEYQVELKNPFVVNVGEANYYDPKKLQEQGYDSLVIEHERTERDGQKYTEHEVIKFDESKGNLKTANLERRRTPRLEGVDKAYEPSLAELKRERDNLLISEGPNSEHYKQAVRDFNYANTGSYEVEGKQNQTFAGMREEALSKVGQGEEVKGSGAQPGQGKIPPSAGKPPGKSGERPPSSSGRGNRGNKPPQPPKISTSDLPNGPKEPLSDKVVKEPTPRNLLDAITDIPKELKSSMDISFPLRQGLFLLNRKEGRAGMAEGIRNFFSEKGHENTKSYLATRWKNRSIAEESGLAQIEYDPTAKDKTEYSEEFGRQTLQSIPGIKQSERSFIDAGNMSRANMFDMFSERFSKQGKTFKSHPELYKAAAQYLNDLTGRTPLPEKLRGASNLLNKTFWSPRFVASRVKLLNYLVKLPVGKVPSDLRRDVIRDIGGTLSVLPIIAGGIYVAGKAAGEDAEIGTNPIKSSFGKVRVGEVSYDLFAGLSPLIRLYSRLVTGRTTDKTDTTESLAGFSPLGATGANEKLKKAPFGQTVLGEAGRFTRGKLSPTAGSAFNLAEGKDFLGRPYDLSDVPGDLLTPMSFQDFYDAYKVEGLEGALKTLPSVGGVGVQVRKQKKKKEDFSYTPTNSSGVFNNPYKGLNLEGVQ